jgi:glycosyltransferase involved in cell wall biosynthesis
MNKPRRLVIVSAVTHFEFDGRLCAYGPYAREIDIWADLFPEVVIAAPLRREPPPGDSIPFTRSNISVAPQWETGGDSLRAKVLQFLALPAHFWRLSRALSRADAIQVRCPGNLGLLGCLLAPYFRKPLVAKYANQWKDFPGEPRTYRWQKHLLRSRWWRGPVLVYGNWPNQPSHIVPFFTSIVNEAQMAKARAAAPRVWSLRPLEVLFVGRLSPDKNVDVILQSMTRLGRNNECLRLTIVGDGPVRGELESLAAALGLADRVVFQGAVSHAQVLDFYGRAHVLVLASQSEGWPKAIAEAMAFGLVCIGSNRGLVPQMLADGRGLLVEPRDPDALAEKLRCIMNDPAEAAKISEAAATWSRKFTLEGLRSALSHLLQERWQPIV